MISRTQIETAKQASPPLRMLSSKDRAKAIGFIPVVAKQYGISNQLTQPELDAMMLFVTNQFPNLNAREMVYAFELYGAGKLMIPKEKEHYGNLHLSFLGAIFNAYQTMKAEIKAAPPLPVPASHQLESDGKESEREAKESYRYLLTMMIENSGVMPDVYPYEQCFNHLKNTGRIALTKEGYQKHIEYVLEIVQREAGMKNDPIKGREYFKLIKQQTTFINRCRLEYFKRWMQERLIQIDDAATWLKNELELLQKTGGE